MNVISNFVEEYYVGIIFCSVIIAIVLIIRSWIKNAPTLDDSDPNNIKWRK
jgi:hypothetical protein